MSDPSEADEDALISVNLRLLQKQIIRGVQNKYRILGLREYNCARCDASGPNEGEDLKIERNCKKGGRDYGEPPTELRYRIDYTGHDARDFTSFCPASLASESYQRQIYRVLDLERLATLGQPTARPVIHQPYRVYRFFLATLGARDRFNSEISAAEVEVSRPS